MYFYQVLLFFFCETKMLKIPSEYKASDDYKRETNPLNLVAAADRVTVAYLFKYINLP